MTLEIKRKLIALAILLLAIAIVFNSINKYLERSGVHNWAHVKGFVIFSGIEEKKIYKRQKTSLSYADSYDLYYVHRIKYSYQVDGIDYKSENFTLEDKNITSNALWDGTGTTYYDKDVARKEVLKLRKGTTIDIYYNPDNPKIASLSQSNTLFMPIVFAIAFFSFAILLILIAFDYIDAHNLPWRKYS